MDLDTDMIHCFSIYSKFMISASWADCVLSFSAAGPWNTFNSSFLLTFSGVYSPVLPSMCVSSRPEINLPSNQAVEKVRVQQEIALNAHILSFFFQSSVCSVTEWF